MSGYLTRLYKDNILFSETLWPHFLSRNVPYLKKAFSEEGSRRDVLCESDSALVDSCTSGRN